MRILFISRWFPYPPDNGSKLRVYNLLRGLAKEHEITLLSFSDEPGIDRNNAEVRSLCKHVYAVPWKVFNPRSLRAHLGYFGLAPRSVKETFSQEMAAQIQQVLSNGKYDCVIASQADSARYWPWFQEFPAIFEEAEMGVLYEGYSNANSLIEKIQNGLTWLKHKYYLSSQISNFNACTVVSKKEQRLVNQILPDYRNLQVIPNCITLADYEHVTDKPKPESIIFTGSFRYIPNYQAMIWFTKEVLPKVRSKMPGVILTITGDHANLPLPSTQDVILTGYVDNVRPLIASSQVSIAPIFQGGGTRLKILEAMALKTPVVATTKGAEGLDVISGEHILVADTADEFADAVVSILCEPDLGQNLVAQAYRLIQEKYDWQVVMPQFLDLVREVANKPATN
jgi:polysaccharide biosynthesis protein PslH